MQKVIFFFIIVISCPLALAQSKDSLTVSFKETPLIRVAEFIENVTSLNIVVSEKDKYFPVSVKFKNLRPLESIIKICDSNDLVYQIKDGKIILSSKGRTAYKRQRPSIKNGVQTISTVNALFKGGYVNVDEKAENFIYVKEYLERKGIKWLSPIGMSFKKGIEIYIFATPLEEFATLGTRVLYFDPKTKSIKLKPRA